ncbi:Uma2 family endonuclease [Gloeobacter kilaueensis]|uniref:Uma2 family endonuclease n=1 Tax=Gloeobacter kilaueensis TaxID=1416614 RepID=UPI00040DB75A|nr:Uma2 family endonuclease [Gloeobacter kilaueensis]
MTFSAEGLAPKNRPQELSAAGESEEKRATAVIARLKQSLLGWVEPLGLGVVLDRGGCNATAPDLAFLAMNRLRNAPFRLGLPVPDLVVKVESAPSQREALTRQIQSWLDRGVVVCLLVETWAKTVSIFREGQVVTLGLEEVLSLPEILPGWEWKLAAL